MAPRKLFVTTALPDVPFEALALHGREGLSMPYVFSVELASSSAQVPFEKLLGTPITVSMELSDGKKRFFHGIVNRFSMGGREARATRYHAELVPKLFSLTKATNCAIFPKQTTEQIVDTLLKAHGIMDVEFHLAGTKRIREYCVQYRETALDFLSRLLEEEGYYYYFKHEEAKHVLVIANGTDDHVASPGPAKIPFQRHKSEATDPDTVIDWNVELEMRSANITTIHSTFNTPREPDSVELPSATPELPLYGGQKPDAPPGSQPTFELFDYLGAAEVDTTWSKDQSDLRAGLEEAQIVVVRGSGTAAGFAGGHTFQLQNHFRKDQDGGYVLTRVEHDATMVAPSEGGTAVLEYSNNFECIPSSVLFRPPRITPRPVIAGTQTAIVTGTKDEEIDVDDLARITVKFYWDRNKERLHQDSSCKIRVAQPWAGSNFGALFNPRIGMEVVVEFLDGDPDRPLVVGCVYNKEQLPPFGMPGGQTISGLKTNTSKGGGGFNEISFDDKKGSEMITIHGQKDMSTVVKHDQTLLVNNNRTSTVDVDDTTVVHGSQSLKVDGAQSVDIGGGQSVKVTGDRSVEITAADSLEVGATLSIHAVGATGIMSDATIEVNASGDGAFISGGLLMTDSTGNTEITAGASLIAKADGGDATLEASAATTVKSGSTMTIDGGGAVTVKGPSIKLEAGGSSIEIGPSGVTISGAMIKLN